ncbi:DciA family protein [Streptomyces roseolus]|uniref:DciA family protein n=1 Tax=Streptomyces roseolus TaxID=67358 RepID=UPI0033DEE5B6
MNAVPELSGVDLARQALLAAREEAKKNGVGRLDLRPDSPAYATQLRLLTVRIIATANEHVGSSAVRALRVLPPGAVDTIPPPAADRAAQGAVAAPAAR